MTAEVLKLGVFEMGVCVPENWSEKQIITFSEEENPCGTTGGWFIRRHEKEGDCPERVECDERDDHIHVVLAA